MISTLKHNHSLGNSFSGINSSSGISKDVIKEGIVEPIGVVEQIIVNAKEAISLILRIDDIIAAKKIDFDNKISEEF